MEPGYAKAQFRSHMAVLRYLIDHATPELATQYNRELNEQMIVLKTKMRENTREVSQNSVNINVT